MSEDEKASSLAPAEGKPADEQAQMPTMLGLSASEAVRRLQRYGRNEIPGGGRRPLHSIVLGVLRAPMFLFLVIAAALYLALGDPLEGTVLSFIAIANVGLITFQELRERRTDVAIGPCRNRHGSTRHRCGAGGGFARSPQRGFRCDRRRGTSRPAYLRQFAQSDDIHHGRSRSDSRHGARALAVRLTNCAFAIPCRVS